MLQPGSIDRTVAILGHRSRDSDRLFSAKLMPIRSERRAAKETRGGATA